MSWAAQDSDDCTCLLSNCTFMSFFVVAGHSSTCASGYRPGSTPIGGGVCLFERSRGFLEHRREKEQGGPGLETRRSRLVSAPHQLPKKNEVGTMLEMGRSGPTRQGQPHTAVVSEHFAHAPHNAVFFPPTMLLSRSPSSRQTEEHPTISFCSPPRFPPPPTPTNNTSKSRRSQIDTTTEKRRLQYFSPGPTSVSSMLSPESCKFPNRTSTVKTKPNNWTRGGQSRSMKYPKQQEKNRKEGGSSNVKPTNLPSTSSTSSNHKQVFARLSTSERQNQRKYSQTSGGHGKHQRPIPQPTFPPER